MTVKASAWRGCKSLRRTVRAMTDREKLIELFYNLPTPEPVIGIRAGKKLITAGFIADHLIANGVTVQENTAADATPVRHGRWVNKPLIKSFKHTNIPVVECSACGIDFCDIINNHYFMYKYCPFCGAKMDGGAD